MGDEPHRPALATAVAQALTHADITDHATPHTTDVDFTPGKVTDADIAAFDEHLRHHGYLVIHRYNSPERGPGGTQTVHRVGVAILEPAPEAAP